MFDCSKAIEQEFMTIKYDGASSRYNLFRGYGATNEYIGVGVLQYISGLDPRCQVDWNSNEQKLDKMDCSDIGQLFLVNEDVSSARFFKKISIEGTNKSVNLEWADYVSQSTGIGKILENSEKTAEKSASDKIYICPASTASETRSTPILDCETFYERCESTSANKADPICSVEVKALAPAVEKSVDGPADDTKVKVPKSGVTDSVVTKLVDSEVAADAKKENILPTESSELPEE